MNTLFIILTIILSITIVFGFGLLTYLASLGITTVFNLIAILFTIVYHFVSGKWFTGVKRINNYFLDLSKARFQYFSVLVRDLFTQIMCYESCVSFGKNIDKPIAYYFAYNLIIRENVTVKSGLNNFGLFWAKILNLFDRKNGGLLNSTLQNELKNDLLICRTYLNELPDYVLNMNLYAFKNKLINNFILNKK